MDKELPQKYYEKLELNEFKLNSLLEITKAINNNLSIDSILKIFEYILREQLGISKLILYANDSNQWNCILHFGSRGLNKKINVQKELTHIKDITVIESSSIETLNSFDIVIPIFHKKTALAYLLIGDLDEELIAISPGIKHMPFIQTLASIIVVAIENKRFSLELIEQELDKKEMEMAAEMQKLLFPTNLPNDENIDVAARYESKHLVGGDYYDFLSLNDNEYFFCIADVSGKGTSAALLMSNFQAKLRANIKYNYKNISLKELVENLNEDVNNAAKGEKFITFFAGHYDKENKTLQYVNAGHNYPILINSKEKIFLNKGCIGLGMLEEIPKIEISKIQLKEDAILVCYTDGLVELENSSGVAFETDNLIKVVERNFEKTMNELDQKIFARLEEFKGSQDLMDDTAVLSCKFIVK
ncbi:MAG: PP2C family protein-serine/threonine phosphatase [Flavobacteriales bacterium]|jgi:sigma-B regulation protein RsbU (phosphoserine phosphatase)|nr:PP2C family protein-serine/threonine phosphatase [Flavobacteriales bacterium]MDG1440307.1 PP2C family protein-serine/threonine phosphatase [Flavobacteriales bacterium]MDG1797409.1 PP2C family protein-serine/threonine phosphatase [Flavobacteriales bacterium]|tara:strand:- start:217 stop:1464 length:1248 start_codon:yes stop_codon:yes gene_type:complete